MNIANSPISNAQIVSPNSAGSQRLLTSRENVPDTSERSGRSQPSLPDPEVLAEKAAQIQETKGRFMESLQSAPLRSQLAIDSYQGTIQAAQQFEQGELVGVDIYV